MRRQIMGLAVAAALIGASHAQAFLIDDFNNTNATVSGTNTGHCPDVDAGVSTGQCVGISLAKQTQHISSINTGLPYTGIAGTLGGSRDVSIADPTGKFGSGFATVEVNADGVGDFQYSNPAKFVTTVTTVYDGDTTQGNFGSSLTGTGSKGGADLTDAGTTDTLAWLVTNLDIKLLVTVIVKDVDGTVAGNAFLKVPYNGIGPVPPECDPGQMPFGVPGNPAVCVNPDAPGGGLLLHGFAPFQAGGTDPATGFSFFDNPFLAGTDTNLQPTGGNGVIDFSNLTAIQIIYDTSNNAGSKSLDLAEDMFFTTSTVPEPSTILLMGGGLLVLGLSGARARFLRRRR